jgi:hypothetical protein
MSNDMDVLLARLDMAAERFKSDKNEGSIDALAALLEWMRQTGFASHQTMALAWLAHDRTYIRQGNESDLNDLGRNAIAAACVTLLISDCNFSLDDALKAIAAETKGAMTENKLKNHRKEIGMKRTVSRKAVEQHDLAIAQANQHLINLSVKVKVEAILAMVRNLY